MDEETKQHYQVEISNRFGSLASSDEVEEELDVDSEWENIRDNIKIAAEQSIGRDESHSEPNPGCRRDGQFVPVLMIFFIDSTHQIVIDQRWLTGMLLVMHRDAALFELPNPSPDHSITNGIITIHLTKLTMDVSWFDVSRIQEMDQTASHSRRGARSL
ncbi:hypothetical protein ANN_11872 [Periplaneta americana]|uniref:Uncharacterized protein n=1 Tax=Periplaneta americana TaxID=6978 RepID=A0ABQ8T7R5_PERAM|nr:hypothetical protein ANN_11872 [Periplaneta americana]